MSSINSKEDSTHLKSLVKITVILVVLFAAIYGLRVILSKQGLLTKSKEIEEINTEINTDIETMKDFMEHNHSDDEEHIFTPDARQENVLKKNQDPEYVASYMYGTAMMKEVDLFASTFDFEVLNKDLFSHDEPDKTKVLDAMMERITRSYSLQRVNVVDVKRNATNDIQVTVKLHYQDGLAKTTKLSMISSDTGHDINDSILVISTSVWNIIEQIEKE